MSKQPIAWHKENLVNSKHYLETLRKRLTALQADEKRFTEQIAFYQAQVDRAEKEQLTEFDRERYNVKRNVKQ